LELVALRSLAPGVFGVLLSLEPAAAALAGLLVLGQRLDLVQLVGMACVVLAGALVLGGGKGTAPPETAETDGSIGSDPAGSGTMAR
jgi:inner membrane transporter RhtA